MPDALLPPLIIGSATIIVAVFTVVVGHPFAKGKEREAEWRKMKLELYRDFMTALARSVDGRGSRDDTLRFHDALNAVGLVASPTVIRALYTFVEEISFRNLQRTRSKHDELLTDLVRAMRNDVAPKSRSDDIPTIHLIAPPPESADGAPLQAPGL